MRLSQITVLLFFLYTVASAIPIHGDTSVYQRRGPTDPAGKSSLDGEQSQGSFTEDQQARGGKGEAQAAEEQTTAVRPATPLKGQQKTEKQTKKRKGSKSPERGTEMMEYSKHLEDQRAAARERLADYHRAQAAKESAAQGAEPQTVRPATPAPLGEQQATEEQRQIKMEDPRMKMAEYAQTLGVQHAAVQAKAQKFADSQRAQSEAATQEHQENSHL